MLLPIKDLNPTRRTPVVTLILIGANIIAFFGTASGLAISDANAYRYGAVPCDVMGSCPRLPPPIEQLMAGRSSVVSLLTSMFMHGDILHLGFNMLFLWVFGNNIEDRLGHLRFALFYLSTGLAAAFAFILFSRDSFIPIIGASGAISGILGAYVLLWPGAQITSLLLLGIFFTTVRTPAWVALGLWFVVQIFGGLAGLGRVEQSGVAYLAHIGGFVAGLLLIFPFGGRVNEARAIDRDRFA